MNIPLEAGRWPVRLRCLALCCLVAAGSSPAQAGGLEQLEQLEPDGGEWQVEYSTLIGIGSEDEHELRVLLGISDHLALGVEAEAEWSAGKLAFEGIAPTVLYRFSESSDAIGAGIGAQVEFDGDLRVASAEARLILEKKTEHWWGQGNLIGRHVREDGESATAVTYSWGLSRSIGEEVWIGAEGSGWGSRLGGVNAVFPERGHFIGPAFSIEREIAGSEVEISTAWLRRFAGEGPRNSVRLTVQFDF